MERISRRLLDVAQEIFDECQSLDTAVRDDVAQGLVAIVRAGHDCAAQNVQFATTEQWMVFIDNAVADWFRQRGFVEWFCAAAASGFRNTPPRQIGQFGGAQSNGKERRRK